MFASNRKSKIARVLLMTIF